MLTIRPEDGSTLVESVFAMLFLLTLMLGTVQVVFTLYSRNVVRAAAQEGARAALERGATTAEAIGAARSALVRAAGGLVRDLDVRVSRRRSDEGTRMTVTVRGSLRPVGPIPVGIPVTAVARSVAPADPR